MNTVLYAVARCPNSNTANLFEVARYSLPIDKARREFLRACCKSRCNPTVDTVCDSVVHVNIWKRNERFDVQRFLNLLHSVATVADLRAIEGKGRYYIPWEYVLEEDVELRIFRGDE